ncbi:hypothetical protein [Psychrobacter sp. WY6]|nr:hypothetical protein [Psychrobacter sp. WY6]
MAGLLLITNATIDAASAIFADVKVNGTDIDIVVVTIVNLNKVSDI